MKQFIGFCVFLITVGVGYQTYEVYEDNRAPYWSEVKARLDERNVAALNEECDNHYGMGTVGEAPPEIEAKCRAAGLIP